MLTSQYVQRRYWNLVPSEGFATILWWKVTDGKNTEQLKRATIFVELFVDEGKYTRAEQEKNFASSLKGYGAIVKRQEIDIAALNKKL